MGTFLPKLAARLLLPLGLFMLLCLATGIITILILKRRDVQSSRGKRFLYILLIFSLLNTLLIYLGSLVPLAALLNTPLERAYRSSTLEAGMSGDCIVVLGGGIDEIRQVGGELHHRASRSSIVRLSEAASLCFENPDLELSIILSGGVRFKEQRAESDVYAEFLRRLGVPEERLILEKRSRNTLENAIYVKHILHHRG